MASVTGWTRLEPRPRSADFSVALQARVHDSLWMLARQWQVGEFAGEDAGSLVAARLEMSVAPINRYRAGSHAPQSYDCDKLPLETLVEREVAPQTQDDRARTDLRAAAEAGLYFFKLLNEAAPGLEQRYRGDYLTEYPLPQPDEPSATTRQFLAIMHSRAPDGAALERDLRLVLQGESPELPVAPSIDIADRPDVLAAAQSWLAWWDELYGQSHAAQDAWLPEKFEYQFEVSAPLNARVRGGEEAPAGEMVLTTNEYYRGRLDWYDFDIRPDAGLGGEAGPGEQRTIVQTVVPTPVDFDGMPAPRWWEFEDGRVDFGQVDAAPDDLARLLLIEFALVYGNDWLMIPVELDVGTVCRIRSLVITDTFGDQANVPPSAQPANPSASWGLYYLAEAERPLTHRQDPAEQVFFLPPTLASNMESAPLEEVLLVRDEMANMAWAIERTVEGADGRPFDRFEAYQAKQPEQPSSADTLVEGAPVSYKLMSKIPDHWIPLLAVHMGDDQRAIALQRGAMLDPDSGKGILPLGTLLTPTKRLIVEDEEVQRVGARVTRTHQYTRWSNGATLSWIGKRKQPGRGEGSSGLRFDRV